MKALFSDYCMRYYLELSEREKRYLIRIYGALETIDWEKSIKEHIPMMNGRLPSELERSYKRAIKDFETYKKKLESNGVHFVSQLDEHYPQNLKHIEDAPSHLFYRGQLASIHNKKTVAIVGARKPSRYGLRVAYDMSEMLAKHDVAVVSGLATGIDAAAHQGCLKGNGRTLAVMATGSLEVYPKRNTTLYQDILDMKGCIISEKPLFEKAMRYDFPFRNRIISGLVDIVIIVEASYKSGSLITAKYAADQGKHVFALPGNIFSEVNQGTNQLIFDGATPLIRYEDVLEALALTTLNLNVSPKYDLSILSAEERKVLQIIKKYNIIEISHLSEVLKIPLKQLNIYLSKLLLEDFCTFSSLTEIQCLMK